MSHPNIIQYVESFILNNEKLIIVMEFANCGDLSNQVESRLWEEEWDKMVDEIK